MIEVVAAQCANRAIGKNEGLLRKDKVDLQHFKTITMGKNILAGRVTASSLPNLSGRNVFVLTSASSVSHRQKDGVVIVNSFSEMSGGYVVIGGGLVYEQAVLFADRIHLTTFFASMDGDTYFPMLPDGLIIQDSKLYHDKVITTYKRNKQERNK